MFTQKAEDIVALFQLEPHPEGGHYRQTFKDLPGPTGRAHSTAILYLLKEGEVGKWHRVDAAEVWHWYGGAALALEVKMGGGVRHIVLGPNWSNGEHPQVLVPAHAWQSARSLGAWTLVGCTVAPGFEFEFFELAPENFQP